MKTVILIMVMVFIRAITWAEITPPVEKAYPVEYGEAWQWIDSNADNDLAIIYQAPVSATISYTTDDRLIEVVIPYEAFSTMTEQELFRVATLFSIFMVGVPEEKIGIALIKRLAPKRFYKENKHQPNNGE